MQDFGIRMSIPLWSLFYNGILNEKKPLEQQYDKALEFSKKAISLDKYNMEEYDNYILILRPVPKWQILTYENRPPQSSNLGQHLMLNPLYLLPYTDNILLKQS